MDTSLQMSTEVLNKKLPIWGQVQFWFLRSCLLKLLKDLNGRRKTHLQEKKMDS